MNDVIVKCKIKLKKQLFPKDKSIESGNFGICSMTVIDVLDGEPQVNNWGCITITGNMCAVRRDEEYIVICKEIENEKFGIQYQIISMRTDMTLNTRDQQFKFLSSILTEKQCEEIFRQFKNPIELLEKRNIEELCKIKGVSVITAEKLIKKYDDNKDYSAIYVKLFDYGLSKNIIDKMVDKYGSPDIVVDKIKTNPYILIDEVDGIGWGKADDISLSGGMDEHSVLRVEAYIKYYLNETANSIGNTWMDIDDICDAVDNVIGCDLPQEVLIEALRNLEKKKEIWTNEDRDVLALEKYRRLEKNISNELIRLASAKNKFNKDNWEDKVKRLEERQGWSFTEEQRNGIESILDNQVTIVTGGAGTGKSSTVLGMLGVFQDKYTFAQTALSGRASCNLTDITGAESYTIHRLLGFNPESGFNHNKEKPIPKDIIILDEVSMVGASIFYSLIQAIATGSKLIMLGDTGQLEAIGVGNIMYDMIESGIIKVVNLTKIHRQASKSAIITESINVRESNHIIDSKFNGSEVRGELEDLELDIYGDKKLSYDKVLSHFKKLLNEGISSNDIQVITPMKLRGEASAYKLSNAIQNVLINKKSNFIEIGENSKNPYKIYVGDKVMNDKNNYDTYNEYGEKTPIFNGDLGVVVEINEEDKSMLVDFDTKGMVFVPSSHVINIKLGYAITCHKLQGSSSPYIICVLDYSHYKLLNKEMVYTMLTRAKKYCILCAENKALRYAIKHSEIRTKQTFLKGLLQSYEIENRNKLKNIK